MRGDLGQNCIGILCGKQGCEGCFPKENGAEETQTEDDNEMEEELVEEEEEGSGTEEDEDGSRYEQEESEHEFTTPPPPMHQVQRKQQTKNCHGCGCGHPRCSSCYADEDGLRYEDFHPPESEEEDGSGSEQDSEDESDVTDCSGLGCGLCEGCRLHFQEQLTSKGFLPGREDQRSDVTASAFKKVDESTNESIEQTSAISTEQLRQKTKDLEERITILQKHTDLEAKLKELKGS